MLNKTRAIASNIKKPSQFNMLQAQAR